MSEIIPAILASSVSDLETKLAEIPGEIKFVHIDVLEEDTWIETNLNFEVHLMVKEPALIMRRWVDRGAKRIIVHRIDNKIRVFKGQVEIGLGVELHTSLEEVFETIPEIDFLNLMSIAQIGAQGHPFDPKVFDRIKQVRDKFPKVAISVDGGVSIENYQKLIAAGADRLIVGSHFKDLWNSQTRK